LAAVIVTQVAVAAECRQQACGKRCVDPFEELEEGQEAQSAREIRQCPQTAEDAIPSGQATTGKEVHTSLRLGLPAGHPARGRWKRPFAFLGFEFRKPPKRMLYMWPRKKACQHIRDRVREVVRSIPSSATIGEVIRKLHPVLNGWCTYFRVGNSNRIFHQIDWAVQSELQLWLRRKHQCSWRSARKYWNYQFLYKPCRLYQMVGRVSHLPGLRPTPPEEDGRRLDAGNPHVQFDEGGRKRATTTPVPYSTTALG